MDPSARINKNLIDQSKLWMGNDEKNLQKTGAYPGHYHRDHRIFCRTAPQGGT
jgi:hypothetical protein